MLAIRAFHGSPATTLALPVQRSDLQAQLDALYAAGTMVELAEPFVANAADEFPVGSVIPRPAPKVGQLYWPGFGANRWGHAVLLITGDLLNQLRAEMNTSARVRVEYMDSDDELEVARTFVMYLVAARPVVQTLANGDLPDAEELFLITLVDRRYFWQFAQGTGGASGDSWDTLIGSMLSTLSVTTSTIDACHSAYLSPSSKWSAAGLPTATLLESAVSVTGRRLVLKPDESVHVQSSTAANYQLVTTFDTANAASRVAGGRVLTNANATIIARSVPASVTCVFPSSCDTSATVSTTLTASGASPTTYVGHTGLAGFSAVAWLDIPSTASDTARTMAARRYAYDWYNWQVVPLEATYIGFPTLPNSAFVGHYELYHDGHTALTRVTRPPVNYPLLFGKASACSSELSSDCGIFAGFGPDDCFTLTLYSALCNCSCIPRPQTLNMVYNPSFDGWVSEQNFITCQGQGKALLQTTGCCSPSLTLLGVYQGQDVVLPLAGCVDGEAEFAGGGPKLCSTFTPSPPPPPVSPPPPPPPPAVSCCAEQIAGAAATFTVAGGVYAGSQVFEWANGPTAEFWYHSAAGDVFVQLDCGTDAVTGSFFFRASFLFPSGLACVSQASSVVCGANAAVTWPGDCLGATSITAVNN